MSSHHIVRENQEPALLISDVYSIEPELLGQLLEWSPTIVTNQDSFEILHSQGFKVDFVLSATENVGTQGNLEWIMIDDLDFISQGISLLLNRNHAAVNILADEINVQNIKELVNEISIVWLHQNLRSMFVKTGFEKWKPKGASIFLEENIENLVTVGLIEKHKNSYLTEADGFYKINFSNLKPVLLTEMI